MAGRRRSYGGLNTGVKLYAEESLRRDQEARQFSRQTALQDRSFGQQQTLQTQRTDATRQDFDRRLQAALAQQAARTTGANQQQGIRSGQLLVDPRGQTRPNQAFGQAAASPTTPTPAIPPSAPGRPPAAPKYLPDAQMAAILGEAQPRRPLPSTRVDLRTGALLSNIPISDAGINSMNRAIYAGMTESPSVQVQWPPRPPMASGPETPRTPPPAQPGLMQRMQQFLNPPSAGAAAPEAEVVTIQAPDGSIGTIPLANLDEALRRGARRLQ